MEKMLSAVGDDWSFVLVNLVDFDTMWGHRNDARAYALGLEDFDAFLNELLPVIDDSTLLVITSDHGNDPTTASTDHSREYVPLVVFSNALKSGHDLGTRATFADMAATTAENFALDNRYGAESFLTHITNRG
jgi:phosphopentomutase